MSNGEVKRWETISIDSKITGTWLDVDGVPRITVLAASDHERVVAELKAELVQYHRMAASGVWTPSDEYMEKIETIAKQAKVIGILKACILKEDARCGIWHDGRKAIEQAAAIERGGA